MNEGKEAAAERVSGCGFFAENKKFSKEALLCH